MDRGQFHQSHSHVSTAGSAVKNLWWQELAEAPTRALTGRGVKSGSWTRCRISLDLGASSVCGWCTCHSSVNFLSPSAYSSSALCSPRHCFGNVYQAAGSKFDSAGFSKSSCLVLISFCGSLSLLWPPSFPSWISHGIFGTGYPTPHTLSLTPLSGMELTYKVWQL